MAYELSKKHTERLDHFLNEYDARLKKLEDRLEGFKELDDPKFNIAWVGG